MKWTVERVKAELPQVPVKLADGTIVNGRIHGRLNTFPTITFKTELGTFDITVAWGTIVNVLNSGRQILTD